MRREGARGEGGERRQGERHGEGKGARGEGGSEMIGHVRAERRRIEFEV